MANNCFYQMKVVADKKENIERLLTILNYKDNEYFIYRVFSADNFDVIVEENGLFYAVIEGDVAWSCAKWFETEEDEKTLICLGYEKDENGMELFDKPIYGTAHYITLDLLCKKLNIGIELYSEECGCEFQEHYVVNHNGEIVVNKCVEWRTIYEDENGNELNEPYEEGGFGDWEFALTNEIF